ncbi:DUF3987 domain-containing protein [Streptomyces polygonati]|uniref:DUF3987 domain-containing protein n=1 Tax=Streptomyces polygonati TaxID=1617087 RepID=A0ABV8HUB5_9ACTN
MTDTSPGAPPVRVRKIAEAQKYAVRGWRVLPLHHIANERCTCGNPKEIADHDYRQGGKHPVHASWQKDATTDWAQVASWWQKRPEANVGIATGEASGIFVLDVDPDSGGLDSLTELENEHGPMPATWRVETGSGGIHFYFAWPGFNPRNSAGKLGAGLDVRADGGQVVAPPSVSAKGPYTVRDDTPPAPAPPWLVDMLRPPPAAAPRPAGSFTPAAGNQDAYTRKAVQAECDAIVGALDGMQNDTINRAAFNLGTLVGAGALSESEARETLLSAAIAGNHPEGRARPTIESGLRKGIMQPRHPWPPVSRRDEAAELRAPIVPDDAPPVDWSDIGQPADATSEQHPDWSSGIHAEDRLGWDEPVPLAPPAPLPLDSARLRGIGVMAQAVSTSLQVPVDLPAWLGMSTASTAIGGRRAVSPKPDWTEPVTLYTMPVAAPGEMKSPALSLMGKPIYAEEKRRREADKVAVVKDRRNRKMVESAVTEAENRVIKARDSSARAKAKQDLDAVYSELEELGDPLVHTQLVADDTTAEAAVELIAQQGERLAVLSTEGSFLGNVGGRYSKQANPEIVLKAWSHETHSVNRKSGPPILLERPNLSLGLAVQPGFLTGMGETGDVFEARGLMARFIFAMPTSRVGDRSYDSEPIPLEVSAAYNHAIIRMMQAIHDDPEYRVMSLDPAAQALFRAFWEALEPRHKAHGDLAAVEGWAKKLPGQVLRIAAVLALFEEPTTLIVSGGVMDDAISLVPYLIQHARLVADLMSEERQSKLGPARAVLDWVRRADQRGRFAAKDVEKAVRGQKWCTAMDDVDAALGVLEHAGWVRRIDPPPRPEGARGRPPKARFVAHPEAFRAKSS